MKLKKFGSSKLIRTIVVITIICLISIAIVINDRERRNAPLVIENERQDSTDVLSQQEYQSFWNKYVTLADTQTPKIALHALREETKINSKLLRSCHDIVHELGHEAFEKYKSFSEAIKYQDELCNSGYLHVIIESHFA